MEMESFLNHIYHKSLNISDFKYRKFIEEHMFFFKKYNNCEVIIYNLNSFPTDYNLRFLCCSDEIWKDLTYKDWVEIFQSVNLWGLITVVEFCYKFIEINSLEMIYLNFAIDNSLKIELFNHFIDFVYCLEKDEDDFEDLREGVICSPSSFLSVNNRLIEEGFVMRTIQGLNDIKDYIIKLRNNIVSNY